ncbi:MAG: dicarboxylate/amino acid:cation symporter [Pseudomonadales bacterium]|nr:dicarboxylate/amino acid:cation symporter [Pseudomonadales bacterium]MCP5184852.1 dicarboxylate/amino acid:cation symporter [Pseudomonadales bacterium]
MNQKWLTPLLLIGALTGWLLGELAGGNEALDYLMRIARALFLDALRAVIGPLILFSLVSGILQLSATRDMRRLGSTTIFYYLVTTGIAMAIGLATVTWLHPWTALPPLADAPPLAAGVTLINQSDAGLGALAAGLLKQMLVNPVSALANLNILGIVTNAMVIGLAALFVLPADSPVITFCHQVTAIIYRIAGWAVMLAPLGVMGIVYGFVDALRTDLLTQLLTFSAVVFIATAVHGFLVLPSLAWALGGMRPSRLLPSIGSAMVMALTTSSSAATLPVSMQVAEERLGVRRSTASFVLPLGATINMDGTALFEGMAAVFLAYLFAIPLDATGIVAVFIVAMISSIGAPGVPSGSMAGMQMVLLAVGIPLEAIGLLLLIERPLDTFRTAVNVEGDLVGCVVTQRLVFGDEQHG